MRSMCNRTFDRELLLLRIAEPWRALSVFHPVELSRFDPSG